MSNYATNENNAKASFFGFRRRKQEAEVLVLIIQGPVTSVSQGPVVLTKMSNTAVVVPATSEIQFEP